MLGVNSVTVTVISLLPIGECKLNINLGAQFISIILSNAVYNLSFIFEHALTDSQYNSVNINYYITVFF